jgi:hypothetical protein
MSFDSRQSATIVCEADAMRRDGDEPRWRSSHVRRLLEFANKLAKQILKVAGGMPD